MFVGMEALLGKTIIKVIRNNDDEDDYMGDYGGVYMPEMTKCSDFETLCSDGDTVEIKMPSGRLCCIV